MAVSCCFKINFFLFQSSFFFLSHKDWLYTQINPPLYWFHLVGFPSWAGPEPRRTNSFSRICPRPGKRCKKLLRRWRGLPSLSCWCFPTDEPNSYKTGILSRREGLRWQRKFHRFLAYPAVLAIHAFDPCINSKQGDFFYFSSSSC